MISAPIAAREKLTIEMSVWDSGCLPGLLMREIEKMERTSGMPGAPDLGDYLDQLRGCLSAVNGARDAWARG